MADYELIDSGGGGKLERFGPHVLRRPAQQAIWPRDPDVDWSGATAFTRDSSGYGTWKPCLSDESWEIGLDDLRILVKPTAFGHLGMFPEMAPIWAAVRGRVASGMRVLNLFAYTGVLTLAAAAAGAEVCHVDAVKGTVDWARDNAARSGLTDRPVRWIVDDVRKFVERESRRGSRYHGIVLDPPTFGRGTKKQVWQIERDLAPHLDACFELLDDEAGFLIVSCHTPGLVGAGLANLLAPLEGRRGGRVEHGALQLESAMGKILPSGSFARWEP